MLHPSYTDLMKIVNEESEGDTPVVNSRYSIVMATAKRARQIIADENADPEERAKPLSTAVEELNERKIHILPPDDSEDEDSEYSEQEMEASGETQEEQEEIAEEDSPDAEELSEEAEEIEADVSEEEAGSQTGDE